MLASIMLASIMLFLNRSQEMERLDRMIQRRAGGLVVLYGRRRVGKTRLLLEWVGKHSGLYTVADQSASGIQRKYFAEAIAQNLPGFADVSYPDWGTLLTRLAREAKACKWRGPIVIDELPYLVMSSPELPSVLQRWVDHDAKDARLIIAVAGSSQRMMQGLVLAASAPLYGRATEIISLTPLDATWLRVVFPKQSVNAQIEAYSAWGGVPRYWELAAEERGTQKAIVDRLVLDPLGSLHREPDRILLEEVPSAVELRPILDAIGSGAHRLSEIASRTGNKATSMSRPLLRLQEMNLVRRETPFGESEKKSKRALYKISDPHFRLWFRVVAPNRGLLASAEPRDRSRLLDRFWKQLVAEGWEELCRQRLPRLRRGHPIERLGPWGPASRWWHGNKPEWDVVSQSLDGKRILVGEVKWSPGSMSQTRLEREVDLLNKKLLPSLPGSMSELEVTRVLFVSSLESGATKRLRGVRIVDGAGLLS